MCFKTIFGLYVCNMKKTSVLLHALFFAGLISHHGVTAQCATSSLLGSSSNMLTKNKFNSNNVVADKDLNTIIFIHRNNQGSFGGSSGNLRYDISTNGGTTWSNNLGPLNPLLTKQARFPNIALYNPPGNTDPNNAYLSYLAPTINGSGAWSGVVSGVRKLNGTGNTEAYSQPAPTNFILGSLVKGAPGTFWATDFAYNGTQFTGGILVYKGTWNGSTVNWTLNQQFTPSYNLSFSGNPPLGENNIAFDPTGMKGWMCVTTHLSASSSYYRYSPVFYRTIDGGVNWSGPMVLDLSQFSCITSGVGANTPGVYYANDLTVDVYGQPHMMLTVGVGNTTYGISNTQWHHVYDITQQHGVWTAYDIANVKAEVATIFPGSNGSSAYQIMHPQVGRSADGKKVFFSWTDNSSNPIGTPNMSPDLFARGFDVIQNKWTQVQDFTSCSAGVAGDIMFPHMAAEVLEPSPGTYKLAIVYGVLTNGDPDSPASFKFLDNVSFSNTDFTVSQPVLNPISVTPLSPVPICAGNSATLQVSGAYQDIQWSNGVSGPTNYATFPGVYYVGVRQGCSVGWDSVAVSTLSMNLLSPTANACNGLPLVLGVNGNALSYSWTPGALTGATVTVMPPVSNFYTVTATGINTCVVSATVGVVMNPVPIVSATSNHNLVCEGEEVQLSAFGAATYSWSSGGSGQTISVFPQSTTSYVLTGYNVAGCPGTFTIMQMVDACTSIAENNNTNDRLQVYPNPAKNYVTVKSSFSGTCLLSDEVGWVLKVIELNANTEQTLDLSNMAPGVYFLSAAGKTHYKVALQR